jgi:hypothetical protein
MQYTTFGGISANSPSVTPSNFGIQSQTSQVFQLQSDQIRGSIVKRWGLSQLGTGTFRSLLNGQNVDVFNGNPLGQATILYVWSSSQASYVNGQTWSNFNRSSCVTPLSNAKWDNSQGKLIAWALCTGAPASPTGVYASADGQYLVPIMMFKTSPDNYVAGDKLQLDSFTTDPLTNTYADLSINYPLVDIRDDIVYATGAFRDVSQSSTGSWQEGYKQFIFYTGSSTGPKTSGLQRMCISVYNVAGSQTGAAFIDDNLNTTVVTYPNSKRHFQDVYGQLYQQLSDSTGTYFQQNFWNNGSMSLSDPLVKFYVTPTVQYLDTITNVMYTQQIDGTYKDGSLNVDPSSNAESRKLILNNGFAVRHAFTNYDLLRPANLLGTFVPGVGQINVNPIPPPFRQTSYANYCSAPIYADFDMPDGLAFSVNDNYVSQPWDLTYTDWSNWTGAWTFPLSPQYNTKYGTTGTLSAVAVATFFGTAQFGSTNVVSVLLPGSDYTGANNPAVQTVPAGTVVYRVKGEVFNGQPIKMTFNTNNVNNVTLTDWMAKQLNYYGGGIYGNPSWLQDSKGQEHMIVGCGNLSYINPHEQFAAANYAARQFITDQAAGLLPCSLTTLKALGLDNIQAQAGPGPKTRVNNVNTAIYNSNGRIVTDMTLTGIFALEAAIASLSAGLNGFKFLNSNKNILTGQSFAPYSGVSFLAYPGVATPMYNAIYNQGGNPYGTLPNLTGQQYEEVFALIDLMKNYHTRYLSNRKRAVCSNTTVQLNAKTLQLEQITRGYVNFVENFAFTYRDVYNVEFFLNDTSIINADETEGAVTCGKDIIYSKGKVQHKMWSKRLAESDVKCTNVSYNGKSRFSCSYDGILGEQLNYSASGARIYSYGTVCKTLLSNYCEISPLNSQTIYLGVQNGKDVFLNPGSVFRGSQANFRPTVLKGNQKINIAEQTAQPLIDNNFFKQSADGKIVSVYDTYGLTYYTLPIIFQSPSLRVLESLSISDDGNNFKNLWSTITTTLNHYELQTNTGAVGTYSTTSFYTPGVGGLGNNAYSSTNSLGNGLTQSCVRVINDLIVWSQASNIKFFRADTGEYLGQMFGDDLVYDDSYLPNATNPSNNVMGAFGNGAQEEACVSQFVYNQGNMYIITSGFGRAACGSYGRKLIRMNLKYNIPQAINLTSLWVAAGSVGAYNSQTVVFTPQDAMSQNSNQWCLLTTFKTTTYYTFSVLAPTKPEYIASDLDYDSLYLSGVTAIAIYDPTNMFLSQYQQPSLDISTRIINGGTWYERTGISFKNLLASGVVKFLYAGQIPYKCRAQTPFGTPSADQVQEATQVRNQKKLLQEYYRAKGQTSSYQGYGLCGPYPDNGKYEINNTRISNTVTQKPYWYWSDPRDATRAVTFNQPLGYTDVGTGRPLTTPL